VQPGSIDKPDNRHSSSSTPNNSRLKTQQHAD
jgi:hypothetical protein